MHIGEVVQLGAHRLMCGDAGNPEHVAKLMAGVKADLVFTSPPFLNQRSYGQPAACWDTLMQRVFGALPAHERTQVLVNLGLVHRKGEWLPYWDGWIEWMRQRGWKRFGWYVWDKCDAVPCNHNGRLAPTAEWLFHFNKLPRVPNKTIACKSVGQHRVTTSKAYGPVANSSSHKKRFIHPFKVLDSVLRLPPEKNNQTGHPAVFPIALPAEIIKAYTDPGEVLYEPFAGSGTSILAAEQEGRMCYAMELQPEYCDIAVDRWKRHGQLSLPAVAR